MLFGKPRREVGAADQDGRPAQAEAPQPVGMG
jgi:hypothetical protein